MRINLEESRVAQWLACLTVLVLVVGVELLIYKYKKPRTADYIKQADTVTTRRKNAQVRALAQLKDVANDAATVHRMHAVIKKYGGNGAGNPELEALSWAQKMAEAIAQANPSLHSVAFLGPDGTILAHTDSRKLLTNCAHKLFFKDAMRGETSSETLFSETPPTVLKVVAIPLKLNSKVIGVISMTIDISN